MSSILRNSGNLSAVQRPTVGDTKTSLVSEDHMGWLKCDGRVLSKSRFPQLFNIIGYSFGGAGDNFNLPRADGRVLAFVGQAQTDPSSNIWEMGDLSGEETHILTLGEMPKHNHNISDLTGVNKAIQDLSYGFTDVSGFHTHTSNAVGGTAQPGLVFFNGAGTAGSIDTTVGELNNTITSELIINPTGSHQHRIRNAGGSLPHNNIQPTIWLGNLFVYAGKLFPDINGTRAPDGQNKFPYFGNRIY